MTAIEPLFVWQYYMYDLLIVLHLEYVCGIVRVLHVWNMCITHVSARTVWCTCVGYSPLFIAIMKNKQVTVIVALAKYVYNGMFVHSQSDPVIPKHSNKCRGKGAAKGIERGGESEQV